MEQKQKADGFSLVELSIVLVIIGLLVGGVFVGQNLVKSAELRSQMEQVKRYQAGVNTFRMKYDGLPGDISTATRLFLPSEWPDIANGDGNERVADAGGNYMDLTGEIIQFWMQLSAARVIEGSFSTTPTIGEGFPKNAIGRNGMIAVYDAVWQQANVFYIGVADAPDPGTDDTIIGADTLTPADAAEIDAKFDDGHPYFGNVLARAETGWSYNKKPDYIDPTAFLPARLPVYAQMLQNMLVPPVYADVEVTAMRDACVSREDLGSEDASEQAATYARDNTYAACQLSIRIE